MLNLTIAIPVRNEERNIVGCLEAVGQGLARRVVVIDSGSCDRTVELAYGMGAEVVNFKWDGRFPKKRNWFLREYRPTTDWVLFLDADEYLTGEFKNDLALAVARPEMHGYWLNYSVYFLGRKLKGGYPLKKLALFRVGAGEYERIEENEWSRLDMEVHEHPILTGPVGELKSRIDHRDFHGISHYVTKHNEYSSWEAARFLASIANQERSALTWKQRCKYRLVRSPLIGVVYFFGSFVLMGGFRDGARGLAFALMKLAYFTQVYCKIKELEMAKPEPGQTAE